MLLGGFITSWDAQTCRDALQHSFNAWVKEFGTGNKEHRQIIEQTEAFLNAHGMSRFAPLPYNERDLPIRDLAGYRDRDEGGERPMLFYVLPTPFKEQIASPFNADVVAQVLYDAGMLKKPSSGNRWQVKTPRLKHLDNIQQRAYALFFVTSEDDEE